jgi:C1A family cysteine protease
MNITELKSCLAAGNPFVFGFTVYQSFESATVAQTGVLPMPGKTESVLGGHAVMAAGYDDNKNAFIVRNSWGDAWGQKGYFYMPYDYITSTDLADDFWTITQVEG